MAKPASKHHDKFAQSLAKITLKVLQKVLIFVGKPFYFVLSGLILILLFTSLALGSLIIKPITYSPKTYKVLKKKLTKFIETRSPIFPRSINIPFVYKVSALIVLSLVIIVFGFWYEVLKDLPRVELLTQREPTASTKIYDRNGILLYKIYKDQNRTPVTLSEIPDSVKMATIAVEDSTFYTNPGYSVKGIIRSILNNSKGGQLAGGSTITQQLVKNTLLTPEKTITRKFKELILSLEVEKKYSKDQILEMYLNQVSYGGTAYGIEEASQVYFGKKVSDLNLSEAAFLAGLPQSPSFYSPFSDNPTIGKDRQKQVLHLMESNKFISKDDEQKAQNSVLAFASPKIDIKAPHFIMYIKDQLAQVYGEDVLEKGGLSITTTLDYSIQQMAEKAVSEEITKVKNLNVGNGAAIVLDPKTGEILAMVGSKDYFVADSDGNVNVTTSLRQPGSSIKLINYAYALSHGFNPASVIDDSPTSFKSVGSPLYSPKDYDGRYRGPITLRSALAESRNIPAVKILASYGVDKMIALGQKMGITTWDNPKNFGLSLTLGGGAVKLLDLADAYATVANSGKRPPLSSIIKITNYKGDILESNPCVDKFQITASQHVANLISSLTTQLIKPVTASEIPQEDCNEEQVLDSRVTYLLIDIMKDNFARTPAFGPNSQLVVPGHPEVAVKTGTSNDLKDNLTLGFNQNYLVAVWVGNNDDSPMSHIASGITGAAPIWNRIMSSLLFGKPSLAWQIPQGIVQLPLCNSTKTEFFLSENRIQDCNLQAQNKVPDRSTP